MQKNKLIAFLAAAAGLLIVPLIALLSLGVALLPAGGPLPWEGLMPLLGLCYCNGLAIEFAREVLAPGGFFLAKVLQGGTEHTLLADLKRDFTMVKHVKPKASRADSAELYVVATGYRGRMAA